MSSINDNARRTPRMRLRSASRRQNTPSAIARRTRNLETRRTNLANRIRELETDLKEHIDALDKKRIEVEQALNRRDDEHEHHQKLIMQKRDLKNTIRDDFRQTDLGMEYKELKKRYDERVKNGGLETDFIKKRVDEIGDTFKRQVLRAVASINAEIDSAYEIYIKANTHYGKVYQEQQSIIGIISDLERDLKRAIREDRRLNQARGKRQRKSKKGGKKGKKHNKNKTIKTIKL